MITDSQYKELKDTVVELSKKVDILSMQLSRMMLKGDSFQKSPTLFQNRKKDTTKYMLDGKFYCKRRIAFQCIKKYIDENNITSYEELIKVFPDYLQGSLGVIKPIQIAEKYSNAHRRFYFEDTDILTFDNKQYVVCAQWEKKNINNILSVASNLGYNIKSIITNK